MMKKIPLLLVMLCPFPVFAVENLEGGQFEVNAMYGHTDDKMGDLNSYGATVAGGKYFGNHLLQLEVGVMLSEDLGPASHVLVDPVNPARFAVQSFTNAEVQDIPVWFNYRYGVEFGPKDMFRFEFGPVLGLRVSTLRTKYNLTVVETGQPTQTFTGSDDQSGHLVFDYGAAVGLRCRLAEHWSLNVGYRYVRSTGESFKAQIHELDTATTQVYQEMKFPEHGTHYASLGVEYRF